MRQEMNFRISKGKPYPLGATHEKKGGVNFAIFSKNCTGVTLELFSAGDREKPIHCVELRPERNRTGDIWHVLVQGLGCETLYAYRISGDYSPGKNGFRFNPKKILIDPYARALVGMDTLKDAAMYGYDRNQKVDSDLVPSQVDNTGVAVKCAITGDSSFDWDDDRPPRIPLSRTIIYETHVRGFTRHSSSKTVNPGTFAGLIEKIPYLLELGVTAVELLPVHAFNENEIIRVNPFSGVRLKNYWGYNSLSFFALHPNYAAAGDPEGKLSEFKKMVLELHRVGIEVILDVVYNHTGEGNEVGPTFSFRGIDNSVYYLLENNRFYKNFSGCGNTVNCNHQAVKQMILDSLRYFVTEMHVDGFRFDLAAILGRDIKGEWIGENSLLRDIQEDPVLSGTKLIAEGWDASGFYKVGEFPDGWAEWNGKYRDDVRRFLRGDEGMASSFATRICGSPDLYSDDGRTPAHSVNFITSHDGFTMRDLVSFNVKNNIGNGENNTDGCNDNYSFNFGAEGETGDPSINRARIRQVKNFISVLMISQGIPMILGGDETYRTQRGNNNCYCQDNETSWIDWGNLKRYSEIFEFFKKLIALRKENPVFRLESYYTRKDPKLFGNQELITWHGVKPEKPDWSHFSRTIAFTLNGSPEITGIPGYDRRFYVAINSHREGLVFEIPRPRTGVKWHLAVNTFEKQGSDAYLIEDAPVFESSALTIPPRSLIILFDKQDII